MALKRRDVVIAHADTPLAVSFAARKREILGQAEEYRQTVGDPLDILPTVQPLDEAELSTLEDEEED